MCGVTGYLNHNDEAVSASVLDAMTDALVHRGPDGRGTWSSGPVGLGHRRLSIIDLTDAGSQPMTAEDGRYVLSYNGEIYNFRELRRELETLGHAFFSNSDTEVVLRAFAAWGVDCLLKFNGMFAFALWDRKKKLLTLARDRYGVKPMYWAQRGPVFAFGSEIKAILCHPAISAAMDTSALLEYLTFQNLFTTRTLFDGVSLLPAGCYATIALAGDCTPKITQYWDFEFREPDDPADDEEYVEEFIRLFEQAVKRQLVADVDVSSYLSGGMDSGAITAVASGQVPLMRSFTCGFDLSSASGLEMSFDERAAAERMSYLFKTEHFEMVLKAGDMERAMPKLARHMEEPRVGQSYPNYYAAYLASKFNKVVLAGTGGDELFGGYPWRYYRAVVNDDFEQYVDKYFGYWQRLMSRAQLKDALAPVWGEVGDIETRDIFRDALNVGNYALDRPEDYVNHSLHLEAKTFLTGLLMVEDKLSMAHSLETRVPFLDNDLVDFAMRIPVRCKIGNLQEVVRLDENMPGAKSAKYYQRTNDGKVLLRKGMQAFLPEDILRREKQGFSAPDASWFRGESINYVQRRLFADDARIYAFMDREVVRELVEQHLSGRENKRLLIWSLLCIENWCAEFL